MITFARLSASQLFTVQSGSEGPGYMAYFTSTVLDPGITAIDINQSWGEYIGFYIFLKNAPAEADLDKFIAALVQYFTQYAPDAKHTGFAWLEYVSGAASIAKGTILETVAPGAEVTIASDIAFKFAAYSLPLKQTAPIVPVEDSGQNIIGFTCEYPPYEGAPPPRQAYNTQIPLSGNGRGTLLGQVSLGDLSANSETGSNASLYYVVNYNKQQIAQNYPLFETGSEEGLQILFNYMLDPVDPLNPDRSYLAFEGTMFFLKKNNEGQWYIEPVAGNALPSFFRTVYGKKIDLVPMVDSDHPPKLVFEELPPVGGTPRYYLAPAGDFELTIRDELSSAGLITDYLICGLSGAESVQFIAKSADFNGSVMRFVAKQNAYAPVFPIIKTSGQSSPGSARAAAKAGEVFHRQLNFYLAAKANGAIGSAGTGSTGTLLDGTFKTSWINIRPNPVPVPQAKSVDLIALPADTPVYYSQPNDAALYSHDDIVANVSDELLQIKNTVAAFFTADVTQSIPVAPYAGVKQTAAFPYGEIGQFEKQILVTSRRQTVSSIPVELQQPKNARLADENLIITTTPQGLLATVPNFGINWQSVLLAKSLTSKGVPYDLEFKDGVTKELRDVMQSNQMFLVASEAAPLGNFAKEVTIADWPFTINVGKGSSQGQFSNILIFKFAEGTLEDRVKDPQSWASAGVFNQNAILVSKWITSYIETTKLDAKTDPRYANFLEIVQNPRWNGILALKVDISVQNFPNDLKGLLAGINRDEFYAHHFGIEINFIQPDGSGQLSLPKSSLFALINYVDKDYRASQDINDQMHNGTFIYRVQEVASPVKGASPLYDFKVLTLQVVFKNSEIKDFTSKIQLVTTSWFDETATLDLPNNGNALMNQTIEFDGSYEKHNGVNTYTFVTRPGQTYKFLMKSQVFNYVEIVKAQFYTITDQTQQDIVAGDKEKIMSRFVFWGFMNYKLIESFDLFSFGDTAAEYNTHNKGLYFSNLYVNMDFMLDNVTGDASDRTFTFDPERMSFDISQSTPRNNSIFRNFPINLSGLIYSKTDDESKPSDLGYLPVIIRADKKIDFQALTEKWYALLYNLNLGSMGALAAKAGFVSQISTAWSPDTVVRRVATGIKLPGVGGQKTLSLQSVLSINIQSFTFTAVPQGVDKKNISYLLKFNNVKLSILGKKLPGAADTQFILFGDATGVDKTTLAWYAAYYLKPKTGQKPTLPLTHNM